MSTSGWQFWIDVGGTFTDCLALTPAGELKSYKLLSTGVYKGLIEEIISPTHLKLSSRTSDPEHFFKGFSLRLLVADASETRIICEGLKISRFDASTGEVELLTPLPLQHLELGRPKLRLSYELSTDLEAPVLGIRWLMGKPLGTDLGAIEVKLGTTRGTNALLERQGAPTLFVTTAGFADVLTIAYQNRPKLFSLNIRKPRPLYDQVIEAAERLSADGQVIEPLDKDKLKAELHAAKAKGIDSVAICFLNAYRNSVHEEEAAALAAQAGFSQISLSSRLAPLQRIVPRADTTVVDAYLTPIIKSYVATIAKSLPGASLQLMTSAGGLVEAHSFVGKDSVLSGPAGGVVGAANVAAKAGFEKVIGFDMGGTSTDVCRFDGQFERRYEMELADPERDAGCRIVAPMLAIETVAAGGGSLCWFDGQQLKVGPRSAGADPGPACYGRGGPLTITDCNVFLGRVDPTHFAFPLDVSAVKKRLQETLRQVNEATASPYSAEDLASGFLAIAANNMAAPIKKISLARGYDVRDYALVSFGGAGAQHACQVASELGISTILQSPYASVLSAYGIGTADVRKFSARDIGGILNSQRMPELNTIFSAMEQDLTTQMAKENLPPQSLRRLIRSLDLRYKGQDAVITIEEPNDGDYATRFTSEHEALYGFSFSERPIEVRAARLELAMILPKPASPTKPETPYYPKPRQTLPIHFAGGWQNSSVFDKSTLTAGALMAGPALIVERLTNVVVEPGWEARLTGLGDLILKKQAATVNQAVKHTAAVAADPIQLTLFNNRFASIAEQMGAVLQRTSLSVNVKERLDFSCAIFAPDGGLVVNAPHIPVHLGSMSDTVRSVMQEMGASIRPGDVFITNDPYRGGSHLPDVTVITPVFDEQNSKVIFFTANRAHHAEIGGITPGSMPPFSTCLGEEGVLIRCFRLVSGKRSSEAQLRELLASGPYPSRSIDDNIADINAQIAANEAGRKLLFDLTRQCGLSVVHVYMNHIRSAAAEKMRAALTTLGNRVFSFEDAMDEGTRIAVRIESSTDHGGRACIDFTGTGPVTASNLNANPAIVRAAVLYVFRCLIDEDIPLNEGVFTPLSLIIPSPSLLSPREGDDPLKLPAVVGGNVETSQRVVDVLLGALGLTAASQGTMNNLLFGRRPSGQRPGFGYYETICGGAGAGASFAGAAAVHTHMTNTRITDAEVLEERFPVRLKRFSVRPHSAGEGAYQGGDGAIREIEFLEELDVSLITSRRNRAPFGLAGGQPGKKGRNAIRRAATGQVEELAGLAQIKVQPGDTLTIETPGGGGFGKKTN